MKTALFYLLLSAAAFAQNPPVNSPLLDHLAGKWVAQVIFSGQTGTHDIAAEWVLSHHYLRLHEIAREKNDNGDPRYEATIFIASREQTKEYACAWLDVFGGLAAPSIGVAPHKENDIPFIFKDDSGATVFTNDFVYDPKADTWEWRMDTVDKGKTTLFGIEKLARSDAAK